jgi:8-oxo-dGTP pyrophosphatase MutT (NUDIX family)
MNPLTNHQYSLVGPYLLITKEIRQDDVDDTNRTYFKWIHVPIESDFCNDQIIPKSYQMSQGSKAWAILHNSDKLSPEDDKMVENAVHVIAEIYQSVENDESITTIRLSVVLPPNLSAETTVDISEMMVVVSRVMAQWSAGRYYRHQNRSGIDSGNKNRIKLVLPSIQGDGIEVLWFPSMESLLVTDSNKLDRGKLANIFSWYDINESTEIVEMVDRDGKSLGCIPRKLVHKLNILHRGIGIFVTRDDPIILPTNRQGTGVTKQPPLYVHQRSSGKSIFPSLYDMFVGGVSLANEESIVTARREVAEELGLSRALEDAGVKDGNSKLMGPILQCIVCTAYNRCVVQLFSYRTDSDEEKDISHQEEEVQWGSFVPYDDVCTAADLSIYRLYENCQWPGSVPPIQSSTDTWRSDNKDPNARSKAMLIGSWDFVPDGLLVWEAWLRYSA